MSFPRQPRFLEDSSKMQTNKLRTQKMQNKQAGRSATPHNKYRSNQSNQAQKNKFPIQNLKRSLTPNEYLFERTNSKNLNKRQTFKELIKNQQRQDTNQKPDKLLSLQSKIQNLHTSFQTKLNEQQAQQDKINEYIIKIESLLYQKQQQIQHIANQKNQIANNYFNLSIQFKEMSQQYLLIQEQQELLKLQSQEVLREKQQNYQKEKQNKNEIQKENNLQLIDLSNESRDKFSKDINHISSLHKISQRNLAKQTQEKQIQTEEIYTSNFQINFEANQQQEQETISLKEQNFALKREQETLKLKYTQLKQHYGYIKNDNQTKKQLLQQMIANLQYFAEGQLIKGNQENNTEINKETNSQRQNKRLLKYQN